MEKPKITHVFLNLPAHVLVRTKIKGKVYFVSIINRGKCDYKDILMK